MINYLPKLNKIFKSMVTTKRKSNIHTQIAFNSRPFYKSSLLGSAQDLKIIQQAVKEKRRQLLKAQKKCAFQRRYLDELQHQCSHLEKQKNTFRQYDDFLRMGKVLKQEREITRLKKKVLKKIENFDREEKDSLTQYSDTLKEYHQIKENRNQSVKRVNIIITVVASLLLLVILKI